VQFHEFIVSNMDSLSLESLLPSFGTIVRDFDIEPFVAFYLWRPILAEKIKQDEAELAIQVQKRKLLKGLTGNEKSNSGPDDDGNSENEMQEMSSTTSNTPYEPAEAVPEDPKRLHIEP
jgi:hypothetical protein